MNRRWVGLVGAAAVVASMMVVGVAATPALAGPCDPGGNPIVCENSKPGSPTSEWQVDGAGDPAIQGFATQISTNVGSRVDFKIKTAASAYGIEIFRLGFYSGDGARRIATLSPSASLPQAQPSCIEDISTNNFDCGNWAVSAGWNIPSTAVSGVYIALIGSDNVGWSHITFIVRDDSSHSDVVFQTSDTTWQAYNPYGGSNFYQGTRQLTAGPTRAFKISYNRPFGTRDGVTARDFLFSNEYPMIRFLERNGYDVSYISGLDTDARGPLLLNHKTFMSVGHDEYWSGRQRANVEAARDAGVNLAFFSGNEVYWKTRWESSIDGSAAANRTLVSYKETWDNAKIDPSPEWTGTWRDPRFSPPSNGGRPENGLTGTAYMSNHIDYPLTVSAAEGKQRWWRNTAAATAAPGTVTTLAQHTLGYESDEDLDNGFRNPGQIRLSTTTGDTPQYLRDYGSTVTPGTTTHHLTLYKAASGALVFGAGTIQWAWGLDDEHDGLSGPANATMQQFTINMLGAMGAQPATLMSGMVAASASTDHTAPTVVITSPAVGATIPNGTQVTVTGTASDSGGGVAAGVEVSTDSGATWHAADGGASWSYKYVQQGIGPKSIMARATDDSLNMGSSVSRAISSACPCSVFGAAVPAQEDAGDESGVTVGMRFQADVDGWVSGVRFYKSAANSGVHIGNLWSSSGTLLATGSFANETASGWQELRFNAPVKVTAGTTYVAGYYAPKGHYAATANAFSAGDVTAYPLRGMGSTTSAKNGLFAYGANKFPTDTWNDTNYWVDVTFDDKDTFPPSATTFAPLAEASSVPVSVAPTAVLSEPVASGSLDFRLTTSSGTSVPGTASLNASTNTATFTPSAPLARNTRYTVSIRATDLTGNTMPAAQTWSFVTAKAPQTAYNCPCTLWDEDDAPSVLGVNEAKPVELGLRFQAKVDGVVTGVRFFKGPDNTGTHTASLWSASGTRLATATVTTESSTGWQSVAFSQPVAVAKDTTYVVSYSSNGYWSATWDAFLGQGRTRSPLVAPASAGVFTYNGGYPANVGTANYFVDPVFTVDSAHPPTVSSVSPANQSTSVPVGTAVGVTFNTIVQPNTALVSVTGASGAVTGTSVLSADNTTLTFTPTSPLAPGAAYTVSVSGARNLGGTAMTPSAATSFTTSGSGACPCSLFSSSAQPATVDSGETQALSLGVKFVPQVDGNITGIRFFKSATNTGVHTGSLWSASGSRLATVTFANESSTGWQTAMLSQAVDVTAGTTYVVSYYAPNGHFAVDQDYFASPWTNSPLTSPAGSVGNGLYAYGGDRFPTDSFRNSNYWVDALFRAGSASDTAPPTVTSTTPANGALRVDPAAPVSAVLSEPVQPVPTLVVKSASGTVVPGATSYDSATRRVTFTPTSAFADRAAYSAEVTATDVLGNAMTSPVTWTFTTNGDRTCPCSVFESTERPLNENVRDSAPIELGMAFKPSVDGQVSAITFYKGSSNTGQHTASLWTSTGTLLGSAPFTGESVEGWQTVALPQPVAVTAGATYIASYTSPTGYFSTTPGQFTNPLSSTPLTVASNGGRFRYGGGYPDNSWTTNYWVDVVFTTGGTPPADPPADSAAPVVSGVAAAPSVASTTVTWTTDESSTSKVDYGTTTALGSSATGASGTSHSVALSGLTGATTYYYRVTSVDAAGNSTTDPVTASAPRSFVTDTAPDTTAPSVTAVAAAVSAGAATVTWTTDESATTKVDYGTTTSLGTSATGATGTAHSVALSGLAAGTYYYRVTSADAAGNSTTDPVATGAPRSFVIADTTAPAISAVASTGSGTTATVTWTTDESATTSVSYGTTTALGTTRTGTAGTSHSLALTGLTANTRYYYRVTSADAAGNSATSPASPAAPASYLPTVAPVTHSTVADFAPGTGGYESDTAGGEVIGSLTQGVEFAGTALPSTWTSTALVTGGTTTVANGLATVSGARFRTNSTWSSGRSFTAAATLSAGTSLGWGSIATGSTAVTASFVMDAAGALSARVNDGGANNRTITVPGTWTGASHAYRVDWSAGNAVFLIDGTQVATSAFSPFVNLRVMAVDPTTAAPALTADWVRVAPFSAASTYTSAVIDAGAVVGWDTLTRDVSIPTGSGLTIQVRSGTVPTPGTGWTGWTTVSATTNSITRSSRYLQYRLQFTSSGTAFTTATVNSVQLAYHVL